MGSNFFPILYMCFFIYFLKSIYLLPFYIEEYEYWKINKNRNSYTLEDKTEIPTQDVKIFSKDSKIQLHLSGTT